MGDQLVTVGIYYNPIEASIAQSGLQNEGIQAVLLNESFVGTVWYLANAVGGIQLQVRESDAEAARAILERLHPDSDDSDDDMPPDADLETDAEDLEESAESDDVDDDAHNEIGERDEFDEREEMDEPHEHDQHNEEDESDEEEDRPLNQRERLAERAVRSAVFGLLFPPLLIYALVLVFQVGGSEEPLGPRYRMYDRVATIISLGAIVMFGILFLSAFN